MAFRPACTLSALIISQAVHFGCAGATETELFEQPVTESGTTLPPPKTPDTDNTNATPTPTTPTNPTPPKTEPPKPECSSEIEPNNNRQSPTSFTSCVSGKLANSTDVDNLVIKAPPNAKTMVIKTSGTGGRVSFSLTGGGFFGVNETWTDNEEAPEIPVTPSESYLFQLRSGGGGGEKTWKVEVVFE